MRNLSDFAKKQSAEMMRYVTTPSKSSNIPEIDRNVTTVGTGQLTVTSTPQQLSYVSRDKMSVKLTNLSSTMDVWWGTNVGLVPGDSGNGDLLPAGRGNWVSIPSPTIIWVACVAAGITQGNGNVSTGSVRISWGEEYAD